MTKIRVGMFSQWFDPEVGSATLPGVMARSLVAQGFEVRVATGFPNYPTGDVYDGYQVTWVSHELRDGVKVMRSWLYASHDSSAPRRIANFLSYAGSTAINTVLRWPRRDINLVYSTPITPAIPALIYRLLRRTPYVLYVIDMWPESFLAADFMSERKRQFLGALLHPFCDLVYRHASEIAILSPGMREMLHARGVPDEKITFIPASADDSLHGEVELPRNDPALRPGEGVETTVMYAGNFGDMQALEHVIEAARLLADRNDIRFVFVGGGVAEEKLRARAAGLAQVEFWGSQPMARMPAIMAYGDLHVVSLKRRPLFEATLPSKIQATMAAGRPIIGAIGGDAAKVIQESGCGYVVPNEDPEAFAAAVERFADLNPTQRAELARNARSYYVNNFASPVVTERLSELLEKGARR